jgi:hypothetical protein
MHNAAMSPLLMLALADAIPLIDERGWTLPSSATMAEAERLLALVAPLAREPMAEVEPDGSVALEWEAADEGWLKLSVDGSGRLTHSAVIAGDEYEQVEDFQDPEAGLPGWAAALLHRLMAVGH